MTRSSTGPSACTSEAGRAHLLLNAARRLTRLSALVAVSGRDNDVHLPSLWRIPLVGENAGEKAGARE